jgi:hypothetical protein
MGARSATIVSETPIRLLVVNRENFWLFGREVPDFTQILSVTSRYVCGKPNGKGPAFHRTRMSGGLLETSRQQVTDEQDGSGQEDGHGELQERACSSCQIQD